MTDKKTRAPRQMTVEAIKEQLSRLPLLEKIAVRDYIEKAVDDEKKWHEEQLRIITTKA